MTPLNLDWPKLGIALRESAMDAHEGELPDINIAYSFLLDNPECFGESDEWPPDMPANPPLGLFTAYYALALRPETHRHERAGKVIAVCVMLWIAARVIRRVIA